jgi:hypothetical protein
LGDAGRRIKVTVRADGSVTDLEFTDKVRTMAPNELAAQILATMYRAQADIANKVGETMAAPKLRSRRPHRPRCLPRNQSSLVSRTRTTMSSVPTSTHFLVLGLIFLVLVGWFGVV